MITKCLLDRSTTQAMQLSDTLKSVLQSVPCALFFKVVSSLQELTLHSILYDHDLRPSLDMTPDNILCGSDTDIIKHLLESIHDVQSQTRLVSAMSGNIRQIIERLDRSTLAFAMFSNTHASLCDRVDETNAMNTSFSIGEDFSLDLHVSSFVFYKLNWGAFLQTSEIFDARVFKALENHYEQPMFEMSGVDNWKT